MASGGALAARGVTLPAHAHTRPAAAALALPRRGDAWGLIRPGGLPLAARSDLKTARPGALAPEDWVGASSRHIMAATGLSAPATVGTISGAQVSALPCKYHSPCRERRTPPASLALITSDCVCVYKIITTGAGAALEAERGRAAPAGAAQPPGQSSATLPPLPLVDFSIQTERGCQQQ